MVLARGIEPRRAKRLAVLQTAPGPYGTTQAYLVPHRGIEPRRPVFQAGALPCELARHIGFGTWTRTTIEGFKVPRPTVRRSRNKIVGWWNNHLHSGPVLLASVT